jgi:hypothetical protein
VAKAAELHDHELLAMCGWMSGHTLKHLLAAAGAAMLIGRLTRRVRDAAEPDSARSCISRTAHKQSARVNRSAISG